MTGMIGKEIQRAADLEVLKDALYIRTYIPKRATREAPRPRHAIRVNTMTPCPTCQAPADTWCFPGCTAIDMADYR